MVKPPQPQSIPLTGASSVDTWLSDYLATAGLYGLAANAESWEIAESNARLSYLSHGFFRYFGKFPPPVAERFIRELHDPTAGPVIDPMVGSGTTLVEALLAGRDAIGLDVNPMSVLIAKVKTTPIQQSTVMAVLDAYMRHIRKRPSGDFAKYIPTDRRLSHWFFPETQEKIAWTRRFIETQIDDSAIQDLFRVALASNIRRFSRASKSLGRMFLDPALEPQDVYAHTHAKITEMAEIVNRLFQYSANIDVRLHDARQPLDTPRTGLVICHPPYFNLYKYSSIYKYELLWSGFAAQTVRKQEVREGFKFGRAALVHDYVADLGRVVANIEQVLIPGGHCVLMMGDTLIHGERINTTALMAAHIHAATGLKLEKIIVRQPKFTEASYAAAQRRDGEQVGVKLQDHLLVLQKPG